MDHFRLTTSHVIALRHLARETAGRMPGPVMAPAFDEVLQVVLADVLDIDMMEKLGLGHRFLTSIERVVNTSEIRLFMWLKYPQRDIINKNNH